MTIKISFNPSEMKIINKLKDNDNSLQILETIALKAKFQNKRKIKLKVRFDIEEWRSINEYLGAEKIKQDSLNGYELIAKKIIEKGVEKALRYSELLEF